MAGVYHVRTYVRQDTPHEGGPKPAAAGQPAPVGPATAPVPDPFEQYLGRLLRLIPSEIVGLYMTGTAVIRPGDNWEAEALTGWFVTCGVLLVVFRAWQSRGNDPDARPQYLGVFLSLAAFVVWVFWMWAPPFSPLKPHVPWLPSLLVLVFTFVVPIFYKGEVVTAAGR